MAAVIRADRAALGQAISLVESTHPDDRKAASLLLDACQAASVESVRVAISGSPGVGKSTLIEALGIHLTQAGHRVAVLAIDPSSARSGGSILGDKTRMPRLSTDPNAFIRPTPSAGALGGVGRSTRAAMTVCEAAGFDVVLVETMGVGQSETAAAGMADFFLLLSLAGAGDELQGIKRGILEVADAVAVTKADGSNTDAAATAASRLRSALSLFPPDDSGWRPRVLTCSALNGTGLDDIWESVSDYAAEARRSGWFTRQRQSQRASWFEDEVLLLQSQALGLERQKERSELLERVMDGQLHPYAAAAEFVKPQETAD
ncbi:MAG: LAO/AO transport system kinase [Thalassolituus oleivorans]